MFNLQTGCGQTKNFLVLLITGRQNQPRKLLRIQVYNHGGSNHKLFLGVRCTKALIDKPRIVKKQSYNNFNEQEFLQFYNVLIDLHLHNEQILYRKSSDYEITCPPVQPTIYCCLLT